MRKSILAFALLGGCAAQGVGDALPGTWALSTPSGARAAYTFHVDGSMSFDGGQGTAHVHMDGGYLLDGARLSLAFDGQPTYTVPYALAGDKLTITDDPATVRVGEHVDVIYTRQ